MSLRMRPYTFALIVGIALLGCGGPNPTLTISVDVFPTHTFETSIVITGRVARSPASERPITISVAGGRNVLVDSITGTDVFAYSIRLNANQENHIVLTASDADGGISQPVIVIIEHDDTGPGIDQMTPVPLSTDVALDTPIELFFAEPLVAGAGAGVRFLHNQMPVPGSIVISPDARRITVHTAEALQPNSIYEIEVLGYTDQTGNPAAISDACFLTTPAPLTLHTQIDTIDLDWSRGDPGTTIRNDLLGTRFARKDSTWFAIIEFSRPGLMEFPHDSSTLAFVEIDADQSAATGFISLRDTIFRSFPEFSSNLGVEFVVGLEPAVADSGYLAVYTAPLEFTILDVFKPGRCGRYFGFHTTALFDTMGDDGLFDYTVISFAVGAAGDYIDIMPEGGHITVDLRAATPTAPSYRTDLLRPRRSGTPGDLSGLYERWKGVTPGR